MFGQAPIHAFARVSALALVITVVPVLAENVDYRDAAELQAGLPAILSCEADREDFLRLGNALADLYYDKPAIPALAGWKKLDNNAFVAEFEMPQPVEVRGHETRTIMMSGEGLLAVLDGDLADALSKELDLEVSDVPLAGHIRTRTVRSDDIGDGYRIDIVQTVSTINTHPGKTLLGCEYRFTQ